MRKVFIGGSIKLSKINKDIRQRIDNIINNKYTILIGDANGIDKSVQQYLHTRNYINVVVFCSGNQCRNNIGQWNEKHIEADSALKGRNLYTLKDIEMAKDADFGMMIWDGKSSGTFNNIKNLINLNKKLLLYLIPKKQFYTITNINELESIVSEKFEKKLFLDFIQKSKEASSFTKEL